jgi:hypothetical protein
MVREDVSFGSGERRSLYTLVPIVVVVAVLAMRRLRGGVD